MRAHRLQQGGHVVAEGDAARQKLVGGVCAQALGLLAATHKGIGLLLLADLPEELRLHNGNDIIDDIIQRPCFSALQRQSNCDFSG